MRRSRKPVRAFRSFGGSNPPLSVEVNRGAIRSLRQACSRWAWIRSFPAAGREVALADLDDLADLERVVRDRAQPPQPDSKRHKPSPEPVIPEATL